MHAHVDVNNLNSYLGRVSRSIAAGVLSRSLNQSAFELMRYQRNLIKTQLDRPTPFTVRGIVYEQATPSRLTSQVYIRPIQTEYLKYQIYGGVRYPRRSRSIMVPGRDVHKNQYGNVPRGVLRRLKRQGAFYDRDGDTLLYRESNGNLLRLASYRASTRYSPNRFRFFSDGTRFARYIIRQKIDANTRRVLRNVT